MLVAVIWLGSSFYIVDASQRGVVLQFGRFKETTEPGLRWRLPWPIQSHEIVISLACARSKSAIEARTRTRCRKRR